MIPERHLTPALSLFSEEREIAGAAFAVGGFNAGIVRGIRMSFFIKTLSLLSNDFIGAASENMVSGVA
jgi:hypothetical protein